MLKHDFKNIFAGEDSFTDILGQKVTKDQLKSALLMNRNAIIVGPPGVGKTTLAKNLAKLLPAITVNNCQYNCDQKDHVCPSCISKKNKRDKKSKRF